MNNRNQLKTGGDPRALPDYTALRAEMMKLSHPARPDVDWKHAEMLCLRLFEHNGVELQTAAWYTLARMHSAGMTGMNEGLTLINALTGWQWSVLWPGSAHARMEILSGLSQRLQHLFRTLALNEEDDLSTLYLTEKNLTQLSDTLVRHELKQASRMDMLQQQTRQAITRLEKVSRSEPPAPAVALPAQAIATVAPESDATSEPLIFVVHPEQAESAATVTPAGRRGYMWPFISGMGLALLVCGILLLGWVNLHHPSPAEQQLMASLAPLPEALSAEQLADLRQSSSLSAKQSEKQIAQIQQQLQRLMALPPDWPLQYSQKLISQAKMLWPDNPAVLQMQHAWQQQTEVNALPVTALNSWHEGMTRLQQLAERLNGLDEKRGKYMTVSELKSAVFAISQAFNKAPPVEEQLRQYSADAHEIPQKQAEMALEQLQKRFFLLNNAH